LKISFPAATAAPGGVGMAQAILQVVNGQDSSSPDVMPTPPTGPPGQPGQQESPD